MKKKIIILSVITLFFLIGSMILNFKNTAIANHCPANYQHLDLADACLRPVPQGGCAANEEETELVGTAWCVLVDAPGENEPGTNPGNEDVLKFPAALPDSPTLTAKGFTPQNLVSKLIGDILPVILGLAGFITVILILVSGIQFIFSSGNPEAAAGARNRLIFAIIGFCVIILAFAITQIVDKIFIGTGGTIFQVF